MTPCLDFEEALAVELEASADDPDVGACIAALRAGDARAAAAAIARLARLASKFRGGRRRPLPLYAAAIGLLVELGIDTPTRTIWRELRARGLVRGDGGLLYWRAANGGWRTTPYPQFETTISRHRARLRRERKTCASREAQIRSKSELAETST